MYGQYVRIQSAASTDAEKGIGDGVCRRHSPPSPPACSRSMWLLQWGKRVAVEGTRTLDGHRCQHECQGEETCTHCKMIRILLLAGTCAGTCSQLQLGCRCATIATYDDSSAIPAPANMRKRLECILRLPLHHPRPIHPPLRFLALSCCTLSVSQ